MGWPARNLPFGGTGKELLIWFRKFLLLSDNMRHYGLFVMDFGGKFPSLHFVTGSILPLGHGRTEIRKGKSEHSGTRERCWTIREFARRRAFFEILENHQPGSLHFSVCQLSVVSCWEEQKDDGAEFPGGLAIAQSAN